jgi:hypothetical protein
MRQPIQPYAVVPCQDCNGSGLHKGNECPTCQGYGRYELGADKDYPLAVQMFGYAILFIAAYGVGWVLWQVVKAMSR